MDLHLFGIDENNIAKYQQEYKKLFNKEAAYLPVHSTAHSILALTHNDEVYRLFRMIEIAKQELVFPNEINYNWMQNGLETSVEFETAVYILFLDLNTTKPMAIGKLGIETYKSNCYRFKEERFPLLSNLLVLSKTKDRFEVIHEVMRSLYVLTKVESPERKYDGCYVKLRGYVPSRLEGIQQFVPRDEIFKNKIKMSDLILYKKLNDIKEERINRLYEVDEFEDIKVFTLRPYDVPVISDELVPILIQSDLELSSGWAKVREFKEIKAPSNEKIEEMMSRCLIGVYISAMSHTETILIITDDTSKKIIGFMRYNEHEKQPAYLRTLFLLPEYRGRGIGSWLLKHLCRELIGNAFILPYLTIWEYFYDPRVLNFYTKNGFMVYGADVMIRFNDFKSISPTL